MKAAPHAISILLLVACSETRSTDQPTGEGGAGGGAAGAAGGGAAGAASSNCPAGSLAPGAHSLSLEHAGEERAFTLFVADRAGPAPLLLSSHGFTSNAEGQRTVTLTDAPNPEDAGYTVVYANGFASDADVEAGDQGWNAGTCCGTPASNGRDDVAFFRALVEEVSTLTCIDPKRIYATGMSNGGFISYRLACEASDLVAAVASMAGVLGLPAADCNPGRPVPVMHIHGTADRIVPLEGGDTVGIAPFASVQETIDTWKAKNGCTGDPVETYRKGAATCSTYDDCDGGVEVVDCRIDGFDHCWAGASSCSLGDQTADLSANEQMLRFFERFALP